MIEDRERRRGSFDAIADLYEAARPTYPDALFDDLVALAGLEPGARLLEVGCGTGKATRSMLERGFSVVCVEMGSKLAASARRNLAPFPVVIEVAPFESWVGEPGTFDLVYAASAWHWLDPAVRPRKAHSLLRAGGHVAFWGGIRHPSSARDDPFFAELQEVYDAIGESREGGLGPPPPEQRTDYVAELGANGLFGDIQVREYLWERSYSAEGYIALLDTFSGHITMEPAKRDRLYAAIREKLSTGGDDRVRKQWHSTLHVARRSEAG